MCEGWRLCSLWSLINSWNEWPTGYPLAKGARTSNPSITRTHTRTHTFSLPEIQWISLHITVGAAEFACTRSSDPSFSPSAYLSSSLSLCYISVILSFLAIHLSLLSEPAGLRSILLMSSTNSSKQLSNNPHTAIILPPNNSNSLKVTQDKKRNCDLRQAGNLLLNSRKNLKAKRFALTADLHFTVIDFVWLQQ